MSAPISIASAPASTVNVAAIERDLEALFRPSEENGGEVLTRACMSNLVVYCDSRSAGDSVSGEIPTLVAHHPARILLLVERDEPGAVDAQVAAQCYLGTGGRHVCAEHVTLSASAEDTRRLPSLARALLIGDLPTALWWAAADAPAADSGMFGALAELSQRIIFDSAAWGDVDSGMARVRSLAEGSRAVFDLTWDRLTPWRRLVNEALDPEAVPGALGRLSSVTIEHGAGGRAAAWLALGWMASRLEWAATAAQRTADGSVGVSWRRGGDVVETILREVPGVDEIARVRVAWPGSAGEESAEISKREGLRAGIASGPTAARTTALLSSKPRAVSVAAHLPLGRDAVLIGALASAADAASLLGGGSK